MFRDILKQLCEPDQYENGSLYPDQGELQEILRNNIKWSSSDKAVLIDQDGIVTAVYPDYNGKYYNGKYYNGSYGEKSDYGNGIDLAWEIEKL